MIKILIQTTFMILFSAAASAAYLPPAENVSYWCYQGCIDDYYSNHNECVAKCYGGRTNPRPKINQHPQQKQNCQDNSQAETMAAACCSWGENIKGCMPGC
ncbi:hypothetical protein AB1A81_01140 [Bdellovibrio bacteriovorus]|nr:hypothetical protein [Bdellovibrio bacteriovorus]AHZ85880.1 hypothetical protein EP01_13180 [Bdellovibrio bacteriovorus]BEV66801.1 hypothetical protein Bb109J_c0221 [Bdellovibrio bacteriovorus]